MDIQRKAFESWFESRYSAHFMQFALDLDFYVDKHTQTCWEAWQAAKAQAVPEGFVLVTKKPDVDKAWDIALKRIVPPPKTNDAIQQELMCKKYVDDLCSEQDRILLDYEAMIEAQEPANDSE